MIKENMLKEISAIFDKINKIEDYSVVTVKTELSMTFILTDEDSGFEEVHFIESAFTNLNSDAIDNLDNYLECTILSTEYKPNRLTLKQYYNQLVQCWSDLE